MPRERSSTETTISRSSLVNSSEAQERGNGLPAALTVDVWSTYQAVSSKTSAIRDVRRSWKYVPDTVLALSVFLGLSREEPMSLLVGDLWYPRTCRTAADKPCFLLVHSDTRKPHQNAKLSSALSCTGGTSQLFRICPECIVCLHHLPSSSTHGHCYGVLGIQVLSISTVDTLGPTVLYHGPLCMAGWLAFWPLIVGRQ